MKQLKMFPIAFVLSCLAAVSVFARILPTPAQSQVAPPDVSFRGPSSGVLFFSTPDMQTHMRAIWTVDQKEVLVSSYHLTGTTQSVKVAQSYKTRYWPTATGRIANGELLVCGKGPRNGNTIVELWRFGPPVYPTPLGTPGSPLIGSGPLLSVDEVYNQLATGRDLVRRAIPFWGGAHERTLVLFSDSHDVYSLDLATGDLVLVASPSSKPNSIQAPLLAQVDGAWSRELVVGSYVYAFQDDDVELGTVSYVVMFYDDNRDGVIDRNSVLTKDQFDALGYGNAANWVQ